MQFEREREGALERLRAARRRRLFLDYDGTLVDLAALPELARPDDDLIDLLKALAAGAGTEVVVVSGRERASLEAFFGGLPIGLCAEHGLWLRRPGSEWRLLSNAGFDRNSVLRAMQEAARNHPGARIEQKERAVAFHYRNATISPGSLEQLKASFAAAGGDQATLLDGNCVFEVLPRGVGKGLAIPAMSVLNGDTPSPDGGDDVVAVFAVGDDTTDLSLLAAAPDPSLSATVGERLPRGALWFERPAMVRAFLWSLATAASSSSSPSAS
ncbi:MAG: trehalose-phosphatase [Deltaproteobacteria bacterium]|nr:trehalose-phosphatase [Deltaproteobacteria bacterium]